MLKRIITLSVVSCFAFACGSSNPEKRYMDAVQAKLDGDQRGFYDEMMTLAVEESDTRAGRRARMAVVGGNGLLTIAAIAGVLSAVAVPNFTKYMASSKQTEAKVNLQAAFASQKAYFAETGRYCRSFQECGFDADLGDYILFMGADVLAAPGNETVRIRAVSLLETLGIDPVVTNEGFVIVAVGNIDSDDDLDVWTINELNELYNVVSDI